MSEVAAAVELVDIRRLMSLFAQGIGGRYFHLKAPEDKTVGLVGGRLPFATGLPGGDADTLSLPDEIGMFGHERENLGAYRVAVMHQLGLLEFGTCAFSLPEARRRIVELPAQRRGHSLHPTDLESLFDCVRPPQLSRKVFTILEDYRVDHALRRGYPGLGDDLSRVIAHALSLRPALEAIDSATALLEALLQLSLDRSLAALLPVDATGKLEHMARVVAPLAEASADVYSSVRATLVCVDALRGAVVAGQRTAGPTDAMVDAEAAEVAAELDAVGESSRPVDFRGDPALESMQRSLQLEARDNLMDALQQQAAGSLLTDALLQQLEETGIDTVGQAQVSGPTQSSADLERPAVADVETLLERVTRRSAYDVSVLGRAASGGGLGSRSYVYDEWDHNRGAYLRGYCRLHEQRLRGESGSEFLEGLRQRHRELIGRVRRQFRSARPEAYEVLRGMNDGDDIDLDRAIEARVDRRAGVSLADRVYTRRDRARREVVAAFLLDLSGSVSTPVPDPDEPSPAPVQERGQGSRYYLSDDEEEDVWNAPEVAEPKRTVLDIEKEAVALMVQALEDLGDEYGIYGFSGCGHDDVEYYVAKEFSDPLRASVWGSIDAMRPRSYTRMGTAIRHTTAKLQRHESRRKVMLVVSDGFPQDIDYGPDRNDREYGIQDTARALQEAERAGIRTFCITIDRAGHDYLRRMCPDQQYLVIDEVESLPEELGKVYRALTR